MTPSALMIGWSCKKLDELGSVGRGKSRHRPRNDPSLYGGIYPFVQTGDVKAAEFYIKNYAQTYNEKGLAQSKLWNPGTLCITIAANIAETAILAIPSCFPDSIVGFVADPEKADVRFVKYYIDTIKLNMQNISKGTTQDKLSLDKLLTFYILAPPLSTQRKIAAILSAYDDLIENNTRRIKILEEMAQALYREWFVHFRFPGHEKVQMVDSLLGKIPEGGEVKKASEIIFINPRTKVPKEGLKPFVMMESLSTDSMILENFKTKTGNSGSKFKNHDTLFARITPCLENGKTGFVQFLASDDDVALGSTEFIVLRSRLVVPEFVYLMARSQAFRDHAIKSMCGATGRQRVNEACFDNFLVAKPNDAVLQGFHEIVSPIFELVHLLAGKNATLRRTRDILLPKLISGEVKYTGR
ncbi:Type-1 restriction enzyme MjaXIP specificity protein [uncultured archaeon]|nr:Type-1 restriction enzyme MjaXIP specificity protein [uncultured archaeon]